MTCRSSYESSQEYATIAAELGRVILSVGLPLALALTLALTPVVVVLCASRGEKTGRVSGERHRYQDGTCAARSNAEAAFCSCRCISADLA